MDACDLAERRVGELSGGEQQRVLLARALAQSTPILLLDEPTVHLDLQHQVSLMETVCSLAHTDHLAVLVALHDLNLAAHLCRPGGAAGGGGSQGHWHGAAKCSRQN